MRMAPIACNHKNKVRSNGDTVCHRCGMVFDDDDMQNVTAAAGTPKSSASNLFERNSMGSKNSMPKMKQIERLQRYLGSNINDVRSTKAIGLLSKFSNCCEKLMMGEVESEYAWNTFSRVIKTKSSRKTAETVCWAIYKSCQAHGVPMIADEIQNVVCTEFKRRSLPHIVGILYDNMEYEIPKTADDHLEYYFRINIKKMLGGMDFSKEGFATANRHAWHMYLNVFTEGNANSRARQAIKAAFKV